MRKLTKLSLGLVLLGAISLSQENSAHAGSVGVNEGGGTISVGVTTSGSTPGTPGAQAPSGGGTGNPGVVCVYTPVDPGYAATLAPGGPTPGQWYVMTCATLGNPGMSFTDVWIPTAAPTPPVSPSAVAAQAAASILLPAPVVSSNPATTSYVNLSTWLWIDGSIWHSYSATASAGGVSATAVATPTEVTWSMGDGQSVTCSGPGVAYRPQVDATQQSTPCQYTYRTSSVGRPSSGGDPNEGSFPVTASISWAVSWSSVGAAGGGSLPTLVTSSQVSLRVEQIESLNTD